MAFTTPNDRIFYACQAVLVVDRNTPTGDTAPTDTSSKYLTGVQSIGVNTTAPSSSLLDVGRFQQVFHYYGQQEIEINIDRVIDKNSNFFYNVSDSNYQTGYEKSHMFFQENINVQGAEVDNFCIKNYDITLIYGTDSVSGVGADRYNDAGSPRTVGGSTCGVANNDNNKSIIVTYRNCLLTNISYTIAADGGITESVTLFTRFADYDDSISLSCFSNAQLPRANTSSSASGTPESGDTVKGYDVKFRPPSLTRYSDSVGTLRRVDGSDYFSILPDEVELMFDLSNSLNDLKITGINSITIGVSIDYSEITDIGRWTGSATALSGLRAAGTEEDPLTDYESDTFYGQGLQNLWRFVNLPVAVTASFTGTARHAFPHDMKNGSSLFTRAADFKSSLNKPIPTDDPPPRLSDPKVKEYDRIPRTFDWDRVDRPILITAHKRLPAGGGTDAYFVWDLGEHNYLTDISTSGGDAGGGNVEVTMSYQNDFSEAVFARHSSVIDLSNDYNGPY
jgi:hypothetical protein